MDPTRDERPGPVAGPAPLASRSTVWVADDLRIRYPGVSDGASVWTLVRESGVLDVNSCYAYLLLCEHFRETCLVAESDGDLVGFATAYRRPDRRDVLFLWQIGVHARVRGRGVGSRLLESLMELPACEGIAFLETTVTPSNEASRRLFGRFARARAVACRITTGFRSGDFVGSSHEPEELFRIGPFQVGSFQD